MKTLVTGITGVGKTTILKALAKTNIYFADDFVKDVLYKKGHLVFDYILKKYPHVIEKDKINTKILGKEILTKKRKLNKINKLIKPYVREWILNLPDNSIIEMAAYIDNERKYADLFDKVILIERKNPNYKFNHIANKFRPLKRKNINYDVKIINNSVVETINEIIKIL